MKLSELIARLAEMLEEHGDVYTMYSNIGDRCTEEVGAVEFDADEGKVLIS